MISRSTVLLLPLECESVLHYQSRSLRITNPPIILFLGHYIKLRIYTNGYGGSCDLYKQC